VHVMCTQTEKCSKMEKLTVMTVVVGLVLAVAASTGSASALTRAAADLVADQLARPSRLCGRIHHWSVSCVPDELERWQASDDSFYTKFNTTQRGFHGNHCDGKETYFGFK
jgi:hypothetical protein